MQGIYDLVKIHVGRLPKGSDLYNGLLEVIKAKGIGTGIVYGIGALKKAVVAYYDQMAKEYRQISINQPVEVLSLMGNISFKDKKAFLHAHITVSDEEKAWGGHLLEGSEVFAFEYQILELQGQVLERKYDEETGLFLWPNK